MGWLAVVVVDVLAQDALELAAADDEQLIEALLAQGAHEALGVGVVLIVQTDRRIEAWRVGSSYRSRLQSAASTSLAARSPERTAPSMYPFQNVEVSVPAQ